MSKKVLPNPNLTTWGAIRAATSLWAVFLFLGWLFKFIWEPGRYGGFHSDPPSFPPLTIKELLLGSGFFPLSLWSLWAWQPKRKHARWHRWLASLTGAIYLSVLIMLGGVKSWNVLLDHPWNWMVNSTLFMLLIISWILPALSYSWAKKIAHAQDVLGLRMLSYGGVGSLMVLAGILGANLGMRLFGSGKLRLAALIMAFGWPLVAVFFAQYNAERLWPYRPWAKEEE